MAGLLEHANDALILRFYPACDTSLGTRCTRLGRVGREELLARCGGPAVRAGSDVARGEAAGGRRGRRVRVWLDMRGEGRLGV